MINYIFCFIIVILIIYIISLHKSISYITKQISFSNKSYPLQEISIYSSNTTIINHVKALNKYISLLNEHNNDLNFKESNIKSMLTNISHDLRTPLTAIIGFSDLLSENNENSKEIDYIRKNTKVIQNYIDSIFTICKIDCKKIVISKETFNLCELIREIILIYYNDISINNIDVSIDLPKDDIYIYNDKHIMFRILSNLISNSIKYGKDGNYLSIQLNNYKDNLEILISDNGIGINENELRFLFDKWYRGKNSSNFSGTGLGLFLSKELANLINGSIDVLSTKKPTTFIFKIYLS